MILSAVTGECLTANRLSICLFLLLCKVIIQIGYFLIEKQPFFSPSAQMVIVRIVANSG